MVGERSPILDVVGDEAEVSRPEATATGSSSGDTSSGMSENGTDAQGEERGAVDPRRAMIILGLRLLLWAVSIN
jgi:hypothetical protein